MAETFFQLSAADRSEALNLAAAKSGRPAHLLEKDECVVYRSLHPITQSVSNGSRNCPSASA